MSHEFFRMRVKRTKGGCGKEKEALTNVYIPYIINKIQTATQIPDLVNALASLALLSRVNKCLYDAATTEIQSITRPFSNALERVTQQTTHSHHAIEFLTYLTGTRRLHDEITLYVQFVMSDDVRIRTEIIISTNDYRVSSLHMRRKSAPSSAIEYTFNASRSKYEYRIVGREIGGHIGMWDTNAPCRHLSTTSNEKSSLFVRLLRAHHVITKHVFPLVEHVYSRRLSENPATIQRMITRNAVMRVDNLVSDERLDFDAVFYR